mmetsp:Transcript_19899/g.42443  ORF Transcript_19899/g.42443 Transcript_19899/m.42443 type:complete len:217 (+) Transcript_19899:1361-2011(+)
MRPLHGALHQVPSLLPLLRVAVDVRNAVALRPCILLDADLATASLFDLSDHTTALAEEPSDKPLLDLHLLKPGILPRLGGSVPEEGTGKLASVGFACASPCQRAVHVFGCLLHLLGKAAHRHLAETLILGALVDHDFDLIGLLDLPQGATLPADDPTYQVLLHVILRHRHVGAIILLRCRHLRWESPLPVLLNIVSTRPSPLCHDDARAGRRRKAC